MSKQTIFGIHAVKSALINRAETIKQLFMVQAKPNKRQQELLELASSKSVQIHYLDKTSFDKKFAAIGASLQGVVAELNSANREYHESDLKGLIESNLDKPLLILLLDGITDPHNLGAILRSADAFGVNLVISPKDKNVGLTSTVCKVACGAAETIPFIQVTNLSRTMDYLKEQGVWLYGAAGETQANLYQLELTGHIGLVMGAEGKGLRRLSREQCDALFAIPMIGSVESLNVSVATGICLAEVNRQRSHAS